MGPSKSKDAAITLGPWLVMPNEPAGFVDADGRLALRTEVRVNGERTGGDGTSNMAWSFADLVAHASRHTLVRPG
jgi:2-keto-4-pentenoate hydratase/2-oxohepta-3-ene-1,7-dioic acid hydratase in catechol pathway